MLAILHVVIAELESGADITEEMHDKIEPDCMEFALGCASTQHLFFSKTGTPNANHLYFIHNNGLHLLLQFYKLIHKLSFHCLPFELQELELECIQIISLLSVTLGIRYLILQVIYLCAYCSVYIINKEGVMEEVFHSLLHFKVIPHKPISIVNVLKDPEALPERSAYVLSQIICFSIVVIGK